MNKEKLYFLTKKNIVKLFPTSSSVHEAHNMRITIKRLKEGRHCHRIMTSHKSILIFKKPKQF